MVLRISEKGNNNMNEQKKCHNCNNVVDENVEFCTLCGTKIQKNYEIVNNQNNTPQEIKNDKESPEEKKAGDKIAIISLVLYFVASKVIFPIIEIWLQHITPIIAYLDLLFPVAGIIAMIYGRIKYPKNKSLKIVMWVIIIYTIAMIIMFIYLVIACNAICEDIRV